MLICPKCGITSDKSDFAGAFCFNCAKERISISCPAEIKIEQCKTCQRYKIRGEWEKNVRKLEDFALSKCKGDFIRAVYDYEDKTAIFYTIIHGREHRTQRELPVSILTTLCIDCSRTSGGYFQAIIQLRGPPERVAKYVEMLHGAFGSKITKVEELKEGIDLYTSDSKETMKILHKYGLKYGIAKQLAGVSEGKKFYRMSYAVRLT